MTLTGRRCPQEEREHILQLVADGMSDNDIAALTGRSRTTVRRVRLSVRNALQPRPPLDQERILMLLQEGRSTSEIADMVGCSTRSVMRVKKLHGVAASRQARDAMTDAEYVLAEQMLADGAPVREIERTLGYSVGSLSKRFRGRGWAFTECGSFSRFLNDMKKVEKKNQVAS